MNKKYDTKKELAALYLLWNWTCLGACISIEKSDKWLKTLKEMETELERYKKEGCNCVGSGRYIKVKRQK
jgi:hypothetical protein